MKTESPLAFRTASLIAALLLLAAAATLCRAQSQSQIWSWTASASHHAAVVRVTTAFVGGSASAGTGTVVAVDRDRGDPTCLIVTAQHVVDGHQHGTITWADGSKTAWRLLAGDRQQDLAALLAFAPAEPPTPIAVASAAPPRGATIEICGWGGPDKRLRHFGAELLTSSETQVVANHYVISGDSGGAMLYGNELVGVVYGGAGPRGQVNGWDLVYPASSRAGFYPIRRMLAQVWQPWMSQHAFPSYGSGGSPSAGGCYGGSCPSPGSVGPGSPLSPPSGPSTPPPAVTSPPASCPPANCPPVDYERIIDQVVERLATDERFRGPPGPQGDKGDAANVDVGALTIALVEQIADDSRFRGPPGPAGPAGGTGPAGAPGRDGADVDVEQLAEEIKRRLPPITFVNTTPDGKVFDSRDVRLGDTFPLKLAPIAGGK